MFPKCARVQAHASGPRFSLLPGMVQARAPHGLRPTLQLMDGGLLLPPGRCDEAAVSIPVRMSVWTCVFIFLGYSQEGFKGKSAVSLESEAVPCGRGFRLATTSLCLHFLKWQIWIMTSLDTPRDYCGMG